MLSASDLKRDNNGPEYILNMITGVVWQGRLRWFITDATYWHLDAETVHGDLPHDWRWGFTKIDESNLESYLSELAGVETTSSALHEYFAEFTEGFDASPGEAEACIWKIYPTLYVNADDRFLCVFFDEYIFSQQFCAAAPHGWRSVVHSRLDLIPEADRYWIVNGQDMIKKHLFDWSQALCIWDSDNPPRSHPAQQTNVADRYKARQRPWWQFNKRSNDT